MVKTPDQPATGLKQSEVEGLLKQFGYNEVPDKKRIL